MSKADQSDNQKPFAPGLTVECAYSPRQGPASGGKDHIVLLNAFSQGRLKRAKGDALCKPRGKFWGLSESSDPNSLKHVCSTCRDRAQQLGFIVEGQMRLFGSEEETLAALMAAGRNAAENGKSRAPILDPIVQEILNMAGDIPHKKYCAILQAFSEGYQQVCDEKAEAILHASKQD
ncbi:MAG: hypothetical protein ACFHHU_00220 [Porticoccaceae bacterium]